MKNSSVVIPFTPNETDQLHITWIFENCRNEFFTQPALIYEEFQKMITQVKYTRWLCHYNEPGKHKLGNNEAVITIDVLPKARRILIGVRSGVISADTLAKHDQLKTILKNVLRSESVHETKTPNL